MRLGMSGGSKAVYDQSQRNGEIEYVFDAHVRVLLVMGDILSVERGGSDGELVAMAVGYSP